jgi:acyl-CoA thioesterase-1
MKRIEFLKLGIAGMVSSIFPFRVYADKEKALPKVLILGDSISIGYFPYVKEYLKAKADVTRPFKSDGKPENCQGTTNGIANIDRWIGDTKWDVIHFNFGLHDIKHIDSKTGKNSNELEDPRQSEPKQYKKNLKYITKVLKATNARLVYATTTPYPENVAGPLRAYGDAEKYNKIALKIMKKHNVWIDDLFGFILPKMNELQRPNNVHFTDEGSKELAEQVSKFIIGYL